MTDEPKYCQRCAREVEPGDAYCAGCGTAVPRMADKGGVVGSSAEWSPAHQHFPDGGVALPSKRGVYTVPEGTYVATTPPPEPTEDERREEAKAKAIADLKAGWWKTLIALLVVLYLFYAWIG